jgi:hypothetical protein
MERFVTITLHAMLVAVSSGCGGGSDGDADADVDTDSDGDVDIDADGDADGDSDGDGDSDPDADGDIDSDPDAEDADTSSDADDDGNAALCDPDADPLEPPGTDDVTYDSWTSFECMSDACLCDSAARPFLEMLLRCEAVQGGYWWGMGSVYVRVAGRSGGACLLDIGSEVEGGMAVSRCTLPLPIVAWSGLDAPDGALLTGIEDRCESVGSCCVLDGCPDE